MNLPDENDVLPGTSAARDARYVPPNTTSFLVDVPLLLEEPIPARVGSYRILRVLGHGGMGTVYEAEQEATRRFVALKLIHPHFATPRYRRRFAEEIRTLGKFEHPGIARIYDAGSAPDDRGAVRLYFAMELVAGLRVDEHVASHGLGPEAIAALMATICDGVHHAHQKSVIHCDLKPANIIVGTDGTPKILDFGIARIVGDEAHDITISQTGGLDGDAGILGTLAFASPEQASGDRNRIDVLTDVYGLGAVLYSLLANRPPHNVQGRSLAEAARIVRDVAPPRVRAIQPKCPEDLETIIAKAIAHTPGDRYDSAAALAADLRRFVERRPIMARPAPWHELAAKWVRRNRVVSASVAVAVMATVAGGGIVGSALLRVLTMQQNLVEVCRASQRAQIAAVSRHQRSTTLIEHLQPDETEGSAARVLEALDWPVGTLAAKERDRVNPGRLLALDGDGEIVEHFDGMRPWVAWARPRFDVGERFRQGIGAPQETTTLAALVGNVDADPARELVRSIRINNDDLHLAVLDIDDVASAVRSRGRPGSSSRQLWNHGDFKDVAWDESRGLLWTLSDAEELTYVLPELAGWDSAGCPVGLEVPRLLVAIKPANVNGVMPPLRGDAKHPPVRTEFAFTTRSTASARAFEPQRGVRSSTINEQLGSASKPSLVWLQIQAFAPYPVDDHRGLGKLYVSFRHADAVRSAMVEADLIASIELDAYGAPRGAFQLEPVPGEEMDAADLAMAARFDPADVVLKFDLNDVATAWRTADETLLSYGGEDIEREATVASPNSAVGKCAQAMTNNWRWLLNTAGEIVESAEIVTRLGDLRGDRAEDIAMAIERIRAATRIHAERCPRHDGKSCVCDWLIETELALALCAAGEWAQCEEAARRAIDLHDHDPRLGAHDPADRAILAIALYALDRRDEAERALADAEQQQRLTDAAQRPGLHRETADRTLQRLLTRARELVRGAPANR